MCFYLYYFLFQNVASTIGKSVEKISRVQNHVYNAEHNNIVIVSRSRCQEITDILWYVNFLPVWFVGLSA